MKRTGNLFHKIYEIENLELAFYKAKKGKSTREEVIDYNKNLSNNLKILQDQIHSGDIKVGDYKYFKIYDPKERMICAASFPERVLHHAIMNICHPYFEKRQIYDSYATRIGKGTYKALERAFEYSKKNEWYLKPHCINKIEQGLSFLSYSISKDQIRLSIKSKKRFRRKINSYYKKLTIGEWNQKEFQNHSIPLIAFTEYGNAKKFRKEVLKKFSEIEA